jgi:TPR repeat protein
MGSAAASAVPSSQRPVPAETSGQSQLAAAMAYLNATSNKRDSARAAQLLWQAVSSGNSDAEVILADLYLRGDGVPKSCDQGKVLLTAASNSGNAKGEQKLQELNAKGCP